MTSPNPNAAPAPMPPQDPRIAEANQLQQQIQAANARLRDIGTEQVAAASDRAAAEQNAETALDAVLGERVGIGRQSIAAATTGLNLLGYESAPGIPTTTGRVSTDGVDLIDLSFRNGFGSTGTPITAVDLETGTAPLNPLWPKQSRTGARDAAIAAQNYNRHEPLEDHTLFSRVRRLGTRMIGDLRLDAGIGHPLITNTAYAVPGHGHEHAGNERDPHNHPQLTRPEAMAYAAAALSAHDRFMGGEISESDYLRLASESATNPAALRAAAIAEPHQTTARLDLARVDRELAQPISNDRRAALESHRTQIIDWLNADPRGSYYLGSPATRFINANTTPDELLALDERLRSEAASLGGRATDNNDQPGTWQHGFATDMSDMVTRTPEAEGREAARETELQQVEQQLAHLRRLPGMANYDAAHYGNFTQEMTRLRGRRRELTADIAAADPADVPRLQSELDSINDDITLMQTPPRSLRSNQAAVRQLLGNYPEASANKHRSPDAPSEPVDRAYLELIRDIAEADTRRYQLEAMLGHRDLNTQLTYTPDGQRSSEYRAAAEAAAAANSRLLGVVAMTSAIDAALPRQALDARRHQLLAEARRLGAETPISGADARQRITMALQAYEPVLREWQAAEQAFADSPVTKAHPNRKPTQDVVNLRIKIRQLNEELGIRPGHEVEDFIGLAASQPVPVDPRNPNAGFRAPVPTVEAAAYQQRIADNVRRRQELLDEERPLQQRALAHIKDDTPLTALQQKVFGARTLAAAPQEADRHTLMTYDQTFASERTAAQEAQDRFIQLQDEERQTEAARQRAEARLASVQASLRTTPPAPRPAANP